MSPFRTGSAVQRDGDTLFAACLQMVLRFFTTVFHCCLYAAGSSALRRPTAEYTGPATTGAPRTTAWSMRASGSLSNSPGLRGAAEIAVGPNAPQTEQQASAACRVRRGSGRDRSWRGHQSRSRRRRSPLFEGRNHLVLALVNGKVNRNVLMPNFIACEVSVRLGGSSTCQRISGCAGRRCDALHVGGQC